MSEPMRTPPAAVWDRMQSDAQALLVCAYDDPEKCRQFKLQGSIDLATLESRRTTLPRNAEIVFY